MSTAACLTPVLGIQPRLPVASVAASCRFHRRVLGFECAQAEHEHLKDVATIEWGPEAYWYGCREFSVRDPDGHHLIFSSRTDEAPTCKEP